MICLKFQDFVIEVIQKSLGDRNRPAQAASRSLRIRVSRHQRQEIQEIEMIDPEE